MTLRPALLLPRTSQSAMAAAFLAGAGLASAADQYWDTNAATAGSGTTTPTTWSATSTTWNSNNTAANTTAPVVWTAGNRAVFSAGTDFGTATAYTVTIAASYTPSVSGILVEDGAPTIAGTGIAASAASFPVTVNPSRTATISAPISGTSIDLNKAATGVLILSGTNTFTGTVTVPNAGGLLQFNSNAATGASTGRYMTVTGTGQLAAGFNMDQTFLNKITTGSTGVIGIGADTTQPLDLSAFSSAWLGAVQAARTVWSTIVPQSGGAYRLGGGNNELILNTRLSGANNVTIGVGNVVRLSPENGKTTNTFTGNITVQDGAVLRAYEAGGLPTTANISLAATGGNLQFLHSDNNDTQFVRSLGTGANQIQILGGSSGFGAAEGRMTVNLGGSGSTIQWGSAEFNPSTFQLNVATGSNSVLTFKNGLDANGANRLIQVNGGYVVMDGVLSNSTGTGGFEKGSGATMILNAANTYNGTTLVNAGTVQVGNGGTTGVLPGNADLNNANNPTLRFQRSDDISYSANVTNSGSGSLTFEKAGAGVLTMSGSNTYKGVTRLQQGTLNLDFSASGAPADNILNNTANSSQLATRGGDLTVKGTAGTNSQRFNGHLVDGGASNVTVTPGSGGSTTLALGALSRTAATSNDGLGTVNFGSTGTITTTNANVSGILGGHLTVDKAGWAANNGSGTIVALPSGSYTPDTWAAGNNTDVTASTSPASGATTNSLRYASGSNTVTLTGANTITSGGILVAAGAGASELAGGVGNTITTAAAGDLVIHQNSASAFKISAPVVGNVGIAKSGSGEVILSGAGSFTGAGTSSRIVVNEGKLSLTGAFGAAAANTMIHRGELEITAAGATAIYTTGTVSVGMRTGDAGTLTLKGANATDPGIVVNGDLNISDIHGSTGTLNVQGGLNQANFLYVGKSGASTGTVNHSAGTLQSNTAAGGDWRIGGTVQGDAMAVGVYNLSGTGTLSVGRNFQIGAWGTGSLIQTGGTANLAVGGSGVPIIGRNAGGTGLWDVTNGVINMTPTTGTPTMLTATTVNISQNLLGVAEEGVGTLKVGAGAVVNVENIGIGYNGGQGTVTQTGGSVSTFSTVPWTRAATNPSVQPGVSFGNLNPRGTGVYNLEGGTLTTQSLSTGYGSGTFNFNGGELIAAVSQPAFVTGSVTTQVGGGGAVINTNGKDIGIAAELKHDAAAPAVDGGLTKKGNGTLTLADANTYTGATVINAGTVKLAGASATVPVEPTLRFDASSASNVTLSGSNVTGMKDLGAQANNAAVPSGVLAPTYNATGLNGKGVVTFNTPVVGAANSSRLETLANTGIDGAEARTYISVMSREENGTVYVHSGNTGTNLQAFGIGNESGANYVYSWGAPGNDAYSGARPNNTFEILAGRYTGTQIEQYVNGALTDIANTTTLATATSDTPLMLGSRRNTANNGGYAGGQGSIAETLVFNSSLSDEDFQAVVRYLNYKWFNLGATQNILPTSTPVTINGTGVLDMAGVNQEIGSLASASTTTEVKTGGGALKVGNLDTSTTFAGAITGTGSLEKTGTMTLTLSGTNTYTGPTTVSKGTLEILSGASITSNVSVGTDATLTGAGTITGTVTTNGGILNPGDGLTTGKMTVSSSVSLDSASTFKLLITDEVNLDQLDNGGLFSSNGALLDVTFNDTTFTVGTNAANLSLATRYTVVLGSVAPGFTFSNATPISAGDLAILGLTGTQYEATFAGQRFWLEQGSLKLTPINPVPEPAAAGLFALGLGALVRRRRARAAGN